MVGSDFRPSATHDHLLAGRYRLGAVLGRGAMADVVHADDQLLGRAVAVKIFRHGGPPDTTQRIDAEIRTLASLTHPGLVTLYDAGTAPDATGVPVPYLVMELIDGPTLKTYRLGRALPGTLVARIGCDLAYALAYIHDRGVVHRDIKPANILVAREPDSGPGQCVKLADFGIARIVDAERLTEHGTTVGTAHYLSPEQATGTSAGPPTDIYTLGLVLIECLTGTMVFEGSAVAAAVARLHRDPTVPEGLGSEWHSLLSEMTSRQPEDRPTADAVGHRLRGLVRADAPLPATSVMAVERPDIIAGEHNSTSLPREPRRRRWIAPAAGALFVTLGAAIIWLSVGADDESDVGPTSPSIPTVVESPVEFTTPSSEPLTPAPLLSNPPAAPIPTSSPVLIQPTAPAPAPGNGNSGNDNGKGSGNSGNGNGNSGKGNSGKGN